MGINQILPVMMLVALTGASPAFSDTTPPPESSHTWECPQADGTVVYTNKEKPGCRAMALKPLSVVPSLDDMPLIPRSIGVPSHRAPTAQDGPTSSTQQAPDWAKDWHASATGSRGDICGLYWEWVRLNEKTRGGFFFGSDPSYGGDPTGRNQRGASYSFYDNARYMALNRIFSTGFIPVGCQ
jgi:hypothetical protein